MKNIILIAPPAAGKGTLSEMLEEKYGYVHISTGDLLRDEAKRDTELGKKISKILATGELLPDEIVFSLLEERLMQNDIKKGFILDGFPRTIEQAKKYDELSLKLNINLDCVISLNVDYDTLMKRIVGRLVCEYCGSVYNTLTGVNTPKKDGICDKCGKKLYKRSDDNEDSFKTRYETYLEKTKPLLDFYNKKNLLSYVDANTKESMLQGVMEILND